MEEQLGYDAEFKTGKGSQGNYEKTVMTKAVVT
jgi:hypothetical protein